MYLYFSIRIKPRSSVCKFLIYCGYSCVQFLFLSGRKQKPTKIIKKNLKIKKICGGDIAGVVCDLDSHFFLWRGRKKSQRLIVEDIGWRQAAQTKKSKKIIFFPLGGGEEIKKRRKEIEREKE